jgi:tetratricopeptide (TPR) repeat protein
LIAIQQGLTATLPKVELPSSTNEILVTADGIWANGQFFSTASIMNNSVFSPIFQENTLSLRQGSDWKTFHAYQFLQLNANGVIPHQLRGESALILRNYTQAVSDLEKAIEANPADSLSYLEKGAAHFSLGEYDRSLEDYQQFVSQTEPLSVSEFCVGFAKGLPKGADESGEGMLLFLVDFVQHPIHTSKQAIDAITTLVDLVGRDEWGALTEALSPEIYQLVTQWNTLPSDQRGELAGFAVGKLGADILTPAGLAKVASKSLKSAQELVAVCKNLQIVQETLILETAAGIGNSAKIAEVIEVGQKTVHLADELGFTAREMGQLKQAGKLEGTVLNTFEHLSLSMQESIKLFEEAGNKLKSYQGIYMSESQARELIHATGLPTFLRPKGIPENYRIKLSDKPGGIKYVHPTDEGTYIRIMPGKAHSKNPRQQRPYVNHRINGKSLDKHGNIVSNKSEEAHIFLDEFVYKDVGTN